MADMAEFDPTVARHLQALLDAPEGMVEAWSVYRADGELVTAELRHEYVQEAVHDKLIGG